MPPFKDYISFYQGSNKNNVNDVDIPKTGIYAITTHYIPEWLILILRYAYFGMSIVVMIIWWKDFLILKCTEA